METSINLEKQKWLIKIGQDKAFGYFYRIWGIVDKKKRLIISEDEIETYEDAISQCFEDFMGLITNTDMNHD